MAAVKDQAEHASSAPATHPAPASTTPAAAPEPAPVPINYEAILTGVIALAGLFSNCVEAFGLIHAGHKWEKFEQLMLAGLGVQQARLLIWGDVVGISSPPASVTDRAIPKRPSAAYPDLKEPTFFGARDPRLDEPETRQKIEHAISTIVERSAGHSREEMMDKYGLKAPKKPSHEITPALDTNRLEAFRERHELLKEVAETYAQINTRRQSSITSTSWSISDYHKFSAFVKLIQEKVDFLIDLMGVKERVDRGMRMDIRGLGWHLSADRIRIALDISKLRLIQESCKDEYPEYVIATQQALDNIDRERAENAADYNPYAAPQYVPVSQRPEAARPSFAPPVPFSPRGARGSIAASEPLVYPVAVPATNGSSAATPEKHKRNSIFGSLFKRKSASHIDTKTLPQHSDPDTPRSLSDAGPVRASTESEHVGDPRPVLAAGQALAPDAVQEPEKAYIRSKSVGDILDAPINTENEEEMRSKLEELKTQDPATVIPDAPASPKQRPSVFDNPNATIERHDQYHGLARQGTKEQW